MRESTAASASKAVTSSARRIGRRARVLPPGGGQRRSRRADPPVPGFQGIKQSARRRVPLLAQDLVCLLDVPVHKTGTAFTKPVDPLLGQAIEAWQVVRPDQPKMLDRKTGERVEFLFAIRAKRVAKHYINEKIIPMLCRKAGVPASDVRGRITSHRVRTTIAS